MKDNKLKSRHEQATPIDWSELHRHLEADQVNLGRDLAPTPEAKKRILKARAQALAREPEEKAATGENLEVVEFLLAHERYGIESSYVQEVYLLKEVTPLPGTPPFVLGIINVHGQILSVIDIKKFFDLPEKGLTDLNKVIVIATEKLQLGILADVILGVQSIPLQHLQPSLPTLTGVRADYLRGVTMDRLVMLDVEKILSDKTIIVQQQLEG